MNKDIFEFFRKQSFLTKIGILMVVFIVSSVVIQGFYATYFASPYPEWDRAIEKQEESLRKLQEVYKDE
jgi:hypothetical protein